MTDTDGIAGPTQEKLLSVGHLTFSYPGTEMPVLKEIDLTLDRGEVVALLGRSGSGKSTLLNMVGGIEAPNRGDLFIGNTRLTGLGERERTLFRRRHIGFIYQFFNLIPTLTARENIALVLELNGVAKAVASRGVDELLAAVELTHKGEDFPDQLSGGEQQRVAIARALVHRPSLLLADEPTGNLDEQTGRRVMALLRDLVTEQGGCLLVATHSNAIAHWADRVLALEDGRLIQGDGFR